MVRSRIALVVLAVATLLPGVALAAPGSPPPASCNACGAPCNDLEQRPFARRDYITGVERYRSPETSLKHTWTKLDGAGVTREWLQRALAAR
jgi:hypothetical protein